MKRIVRRIKMNLADLTIQKAEGNEKPFGVELLIDGVVTIKQYFQTGRLAWAYGENWKMLSGHYNYRLNDKLEKEK